MLLDLALQLVRDGEGATKFVKITVAGAENPVSARKIARSVAERPLVALEDVAEGGFFKRMSDDFWLWWESE